MSKLNVADLYCGGGGFSAGAEKTGEAKLRVGVNHWEMAIKTHSANFPNALHINSRVEDASPGEYGGKLHLLLAAPECIGHSNARGGRPTTDQKRAQARDLLPWLDYHKPEWFVVENVREFMRWGPLNKKGKPIKEKNGIFFEQWLQSLKDAGYNLEFRLLNAADVGANTSRIRLFIIGRRGRRKARINWPEPTHSKTGVGGLPRWRPAHEIIKWDRACPSIFTRARPLKAKTILRIAVGLRKFCGFLDPFMIHYHNNCDAVNINDPVQTILAQGRHHGLAVPYMVQWDQTGGRGSATRSVDDPMFTMCTKANTGLAVPYMIPFFGEAAGQMPRSHDPNDPLPTVTSHGAGGIAMPFQYTLIGNGAGRSRNVMDPVPTIVACRENHGVVMPYIVETAHDGIRRPTDTGEVLGTLTTKRNQGVVIPVIQQYYGTGHCDSIDEPLSTLTTKERHAMVTFRPELPWSHEGHPGFGDIDFATEQAMASLLSAMRDLGIADIGFRMLDNDELAAAQGFEPDYIFHGNKSEVTKQVGNSVSPHAAEALVKALVS